MLRITLYHARFSSYRYRALNFRQLTWTFPPLHHIPLLCDLFGVPAEVFLQGLMSGGAGVDNDMTRVQLCVARVTDPALRQKIVRVVDILSL